jgi:hypothetical protein
VSIRGNIFCASAAEHTPTLPHEYQFNLDSVAGKLALARSLEFLSSIGASR